MMITAILQALFLFLTGVNHRVQIKVQEKTQDYQAAMLKAEAANEAKSLFLANMSHEFRTPLNAIIGFTDLSLRAKIEGPTQRHLNKVKESSRHLLQLVNQVLDFSKLESQNMELDAINFDLIKVLQKCLDICQLQAHRKSIDLILSPLPQTELWLTGDPLRIEQILLNLCNNAIKFTEQGSVTVQLEITSQTQSAVAFNLNIIDTGIGMSEQHLTTIFQAFKQADSSITRRYGGTGLGLSICQQLTHAMQGDISVTSQEGRGSHFTVSLELPLAKPKSQTNANNKPIINKVEKPLPTVLQRRETKQPNASAAL